MTREEAIQFLDNMRGHESGRAIGAEGFYAELCGYHMQALNMAIKALEQEPCEDANANQHNSNALNDVGQHKNALEEDAISRQAAISDIKEMPEWHTGDAFNADRVIRHLKDLPSVTPKAEPCEDAISRQDLLDMAITLRDIANPDKEWEVVTVRTIKRLKSVTPKQRTGHNCNEDYADSDQFVCSECGIELQDWHRIERDEDDGEITCHEYAMKYCPNCGAKMEE